MIALTTEHIRLGADAATKEDAIRAAAAVLVEAADADPAYAESMLARERQANTFLGNGLAIPHGLKKDGALIRRTSVCVVQFPDGVEWGPGQIVRILVGIAATSDEHLKILSSVTGLIDDVAAVDRLATTDDPSEIIAVLSRAPRGAEVASFEGFEDGEHAEANLRPGHGLHARPATRFVAVAGEFSSDIRVAFDGKVVNGKSIGSLLSLSAGGGAKLRVSAQGADAASAVATLKRAVEEGLGDEQEAPATIDTRVWAPEAKTHAVKGVSASPGIAIGPLHYVRQVSLDVEDIAGDADGETQKLSSAIIAVKHDLQALYGSMTERAAGGEAAIFRAHEAFLDDPEIYREACALIMDGHGAAWSWRATIDARAADMRRAADLRDVGDRVLRRLVGAAGSGSLTLDRPCIVVADDLAPSDIAEFDPDFLLGFVTAKGGPTSHAAIIAKALGVPAIVGAAHFEVGAQGVAVLEGTSGSLYLSPSDADLAAARRFQIKLKNRSEEIRAERFLPAVTTDGSRVEIAANIGAVADAAAAIENGAEGVGLLRTEFLFLDRDAPPSEDEQFEAYAEMGRALTGLPLIIRTLDIGGDKHVPYLSLPKECNPFLGVRGVRLCLREPDLFRRQLRAIYRVAGGSPVKIMFPMVSTLEELRAAKEIAEAVRADVGAPRVEIGIMVETPATAALASEFAKESDFFSIGTNDLTQYALAMDRTHSAFGDEADGLHPAVLRLIDQTIRGAAREGIWVGACGGVAGDPLGATILTGLGVDELSMDIASIPTVKAHLRGVSLAEAQNLARRALASGTAADVRALGR